jgi:hypothetical protein
MSAQYANQKFEIQNKLNQEMGLIEIEFVFEEETQVEKVTEKPVSVEDYSLGPRVTRKDLSKDRKGRRSKSIKAKRNYVKDRLSDPNQRFLSM